MYRCCYECYNCLLWCGNIVSRMAQFTINRYSRSSKCVCRSLRCSGNCTAESPCCFLRCVSLSLGSFFTTERELLSLRRRHRDGQTPVVLDVDEWKNKFNAEHIHNPYHADSARKTLCARVVLYRSHLAHRRSRSCKSYK